MPASGLFVDASVYLDTDAMPYADVKTRDGCVWATIGSFPSHVNIHGTPEQLARIARAILAGVNRIKDEAQGEVDGEAKPVCDVMGCDHPATASSLWCAMHAEKIGSTDAAAQDPGPDPAMTRPVTVVKANPAPLAIKVNGNGHMPAPSVVSIGVQPGIGDRVEYRHAYSVPWRPGIVTKVIEDKGKIEGYYVRDLADNRVIYRSAEEVSRPTTKEENATI